MSVDWAKHARAVIEALGDDATWTHAATPKAVTGVYVEPFRVLQVGEVALGGSQPRFVVMSADVVGIARGDTLTLGSSTWKILEAQAEKPVGVSVLTLEA